MKNIEELFEPKKNINKKNPEKKMESEKTSEERRPKSKKSIRKILFIIFSIIFILAFFVFAGMTGYFYRQYKKAISSSVSENINETEIIVGKIKKFMELPDEIPTLATVADKDKLKDQVFFTKAENGDKVLIFIQAKKAILYRPTTEKVVETSVLSENEPTIKQENIQEKNDVNVTPISSPMPTLEEKPKEEAKDEIKKEKIKVAIYNGTNTAGLAKNMADKIATLENIEIIEKTNAKNNYTRNIVIDLSGNNSDTAQKIAQMVNGEVETNLSEGEQKPKVDILIIGGKE